MIINSDNKIYFPALTGVRAVAAYMVYIHHYNPFSVATFGQNVHDFFNEFHIGVTIFFVLSGFLICERYFDDKQFNFKQYFVRRFARTYPVYFILTTFTFLFFAVLHAKIGSVDFRDYLFNISFIKGFLSDLKFTGIAQAWSLTVEELFYLFAPILFLLIKKGKIFLIIAPLFFIGLGLLLVTIFEDSNCYGFMNSINFMLDFTFFGRVTEFFAGITAALIIKNYGFCFKYKIITALGFIIIFLCICALVSLKIGNGYGVDTFSGKIINTILLPIFGIAPLFIGLIGEQTLFSKFLSSKIMLMLGKSSYVFYLIHLGVFVNILNKISTNQLFVFLSLNIIAIVLYKYLESPLNTFIRKKVGV